MSEIYQKIIRFNSLLSAWREFKKGKKSKKDVLEFEFKLEENLFTIQQDLIHKTYEHAGYIKFYIKDPKMRLIHKAIVKDRLIHHLVSGHLESIFEPEFITHSYSSRKDKGTHKAVLTLQDMANRISHGGQKNCWVLKLDIKKFFASVNHQILIETLLRKINDQDFIELLQKIIKSFPDKGIPIGNLTSQYFANIYLNELDQFIAKGLKIQYYIRYADDFVFFSENRQDLLDLIPRIQHFLESKLDLILHPQKIILRKFRSGVDFLGYIVFPKHILPRTKTKRRLIRKIKERINEYRSGKITREKLRATINSYLGYLSHANTYQFRKELIAMIKFELEIQEPKPNPPTGGPNP